MPEPFFLTHADHWVLIPTVSVASPQCECCGNGPVILSIDFLCFSIGLAFDFDEPCA